MPRWGGPDRSVNQFEIRRGSAPELLQTLPDESVHCCVTSPPYWGLRTYGTKPQIWHGDPLCDHRFGEKLQHARGGRNFCVRCGAWRGELGLEPAPELYVEHVVKIFREVRRVLRKSGTVWLVLGDSYAGSWGNQGRKEGRGLQRPARGPMIQNLEPYPNGKHNTGSWINSHPTLKPKDLIGIPWRVASALQADGWYLRSDIIWAKPAPMPESAQDRPTRSHEHIFLMAKSRRYFYDAQAIAEPLARPDETYRVTRAKFGGADKFGQARQQSRLHSGNEYRGTTTGTRNKRDVWVVHTAGFPGAHFATFPEELAKICILAGTSERGCCPECGAPWKRMVERTSVDPVDYQGKWKTADPQASARRMLANVRARRQAGEAHDNPFPAPKTVGWRPTCGHGKDPVSCTVLDPFCGSGTTGLVALRLGRHFIGVELNTNYVKMARQRIVGDKRCA